MLYLFHFCLAYFHTFRLHKLQYSYFLLFYYLFQILLHPTKLAGRLKHQRPYLHSSFLLLHSSNKVSLFQPLLYVLLFQGCITDHTFTHMLSLFSTIILCVLYSYLLFWIYVGGKPSNLKIRINKQASIHSLKSLEMASQSRHQSPKRHLGGTHAYIDFCHFIDYDGFHTTTRILVYLGGTLIQGSFVYCSLFKFN